MNKLLAAVVSSGNRIGAALTPISAVKPGFFRFAKHLCALYNVYITYQIYTSCAQTS